MRFLRAYESELLLSVSPCSRPNLRLAASILVSCGVRLPERGLCNPSASNPQQRMAEYPPFESIIFSLPGRAIQLLLDCQRRHSRLEYPKYN
jgi:hypothetical protein